ncbi:hypothetical protein [Enterococcus sp.]|uniref:hypothetical protein n=1 Tax=Enterococcus sp. TaxID=35783 RepID=UPI0029081994|nr:hypothetical protein [Enterococcus sp.]MDU5334910.1 hypothetical protein [Enterococcus sp.]
MTEDLIVTFGKGDGSTHDWTYRGLGPNLPTPKIKEACELLTKLDICTENGVKLFDSVVTAKVLTHIDTVMFGPDTETKGLTYYGKPAKVSNCEEVQCFNVTEEPQEKPAAPKQTVLPTTPHGRYFKRLTSIEPTEKLEATVEKDALPQSKILPIQQIEPKQDSAPLSEPDSIQETNARNGLLQWLHRIRKKNKEGPTEIPRE